MDGKRRNVWHRTAGGPARWRMSPQALLRLGVALLVLACLLPQGAGAEYRRKLCEVCGRGWDESPSRMVFHLDFGKRVKTVRVCGPFCLCERLERHPDVPPQDVLICAYKDHAKTDASMIYADKAVFLYGVRGDEKQAREPYVAGFATHSEAEDAKKQMGGEILSWDEVFKRCKKLAADWEPKQDEHYQELHQHPPR